jgi:hypothetical protein
MNQPTLHELHHYLDRIPGVQPDEIIQYLSYNELSYRRAKQCATLQTQFPDIWKDTLQHSLKEKAEMDSLSMTQLTTYIKNGYHPETLIKSLLSNELILKDYGKCIEHSGSTWAFLSSALYKVSATTDKQEE